METSGKVPVPIAQKEAYSWQQLGGYLLAALLPAAVFLARIKMAVPGDHFFSLYVLAVILTAGLRQIWQTEREYHDEFRYVMPDGMVRWFAMQANFFPGETPAEDRISGLTMEITDRKRAEETLRQAEKLSAAGRMAATIAHEINNPLESVLNALYLLERDIASSQTAGYLGVAGLGASR